MKDYGTRVHVGIENEAFNAIASIVFILLYQVSPIEINLITIFSYVGDLRRTATAAQKVPDKTQHNYNITL